jgi:hypothetical protein
MDRIRRVIIETPYRGDVVSNLSFARQCVLHSIWLGEAPIASHLLYTQVLDDKDQKHRELGIALGLVWRSAADYSVFYTDLGWSNGMMAALLSAAAEAYPFRIRGLDKAPRLPDVAFPLRVICERAIDEGSNDGQTQQAFTGAHTDPS